MVTKTLPHDIIQKVDEALHIIGKPYSILTMPSTGDDHTPLSIETGCFCWRLVVKVPAVTDFDSTAEYVKHTLYPTLNSIPDLEKVRAQLIDQRAITYIGADCEWKQFGMSAFPSIVVAPTTDQFDILRIERTTAGNYDIQTGDLIKELKSIDRKYGIDIIATDSGTIEFKLKKVPVGQAELDFKQWLNDFAPDMDAPDEVRDLIKLGWD